MTGLQHARTWASTYDREPNPLIALEESITSKEAVR